MSDYFKEPVEVYSSEPEHISGFRKYLERELGFTDPIQQEQAIELFDAWLIVTMRKLGILPPGDPIENLRLELIIEGITDPEQQRPILQNFYRNYIDPPLRNI